MELAELKTAYPRIKMTNLRKGKGKHAKKNVVDVVCRCGAKQTVATSDLWLKRCPKCEAKINESPKRGRKSTTKRAK